MVALSRSFNQEHSHRVRSSISNLEALQAPEVVQLIGVCPEDLTIVTEYHPLGSLDKLDTVLADLEKDSLEVRLRLATNYVAIISYLHANHRVMCDTFTLELTLRQFLVKRDLHLVVNDLDALPEVDASRGLLVKCSDTELEGDFVAPEQRWPSSFRDEGLAFSLENMPAYDEKSDIWKFPEIARYLLGNVPGGDVALSHLSQIHTECKRTDPAMRPSAQEVLRVYRQVCAKMI